jgi:hypothetical protein
MMRLLNRREVYDVVPDLQPLWPQAIRIACAISDMKSERRQDTAQRLWAMYNALYSAFLDTVRAMHERGTTEQLVKLKPIVKRVLKTEAQWLVFHCPAPGGELLHIMV